MTQFYDISELHKEWKQGSKLYLEFLRVPEMSVGVYVLQPGCVDLQLPHKEVEIYYIVKGRARMLAGSDDRLVKQGSIVFVEAGKEHRFHNIEEELVLLVIFAPAET
jgi:mannose-6-phosphate isomerase-like protein (cupin superfamily)